LNLAPNLKIIKLRSSISKKTLKKSLIKFVIFFVQTDVTYYTKMFNRLFLKRKKEKGIHQNLGFKKNSKWAKIQKNQ
jgi:hypothetical protein